jgi:hypothetical protein
MSPILFARANAVIEYLVRLLTSESGTELTTSALQCSVRNRGIN